MDSHGDTESWRHKFLECVQENILYQHITEHTGVVAPSVLDLIFTFNNMETVDIRYDTPLRKCDHILPEIDYVVSGDIKRPEVQPNSGSR